MPSNEPTTGGTLGTGGMPAQAGQQQTAPTPPAGGTPQAARNTNDGTGGTPAPGGTPEQPEDVTGLKNALRLTREERDELKARARTAEEERDALRTATQTEHEKAIDAARKEAATEAETKWHGHVRHSGIRQALTAAGISGSELDLAAGAPEFAALKVNEQGRVEDLDKIVNAFKDSHPALFASTPRPSGSIDAGAHGTTSASEQADAALAEGDVKGAIALKNRLLAERART